MQTDIELQTKQKTNKIELQINQQNNKTDWDEGDDTFIDIILLYMVFFVYFG